MLISEPIQKKSVQRTIEYINRSLEFFYHTEYLLDMFENDLFYIDYRERKKVVLQLPMLSVERDDECVLSILKVKVLKASHRTLSNQSTPGQWRTGAQIKQDCSVVGVSHCLVSEKQQRGLCNDYNERVFLLPLCY